MKPNWKDAPEWAKWLAVDKCGEWFWFEEKPRRGQLEWFPGEGEIACADINTWEDSLEERP